MERNYLFWICMVLFVLHQLIQRIPALSFPLLNNYLDPLLFMPILLHGVAWERSWLLKRKTKLKWYEIVLWTLVTMVLFEYILPKYDERFISDPVDVVMYTAGSILYDCFGRFKE